MAKNRNKSKNKNAAVSMDITEPTVSDIPQAMDTSESVAEKPAARKVKGRQMKRSKNVRKMKAIVKAISKSEQTVEKVMKNDSKMSRIQSAKLLYD